MEEIYLLHKLNAEKGSLVHTFVSILEKRVGRDFYFHLYNIYNNFHMLIGDQGKLNSLVADNNALLDNYSYADKSLKSNMSELLSTKAYAKLETFSDFNSYEDANEELIKIRAEYNNMFDKMLEQCDLARRSSGLENEIKNLKIKLKTTSKSIRSSYESLRNLGEVKIFTMATKNECCLDFIRIINDPKSLNIFDKLWAYALNEAKVLIDCANKSMKHTLNNNNGKDILDEQEKQVAYSCFEKFETSGNVLCTLTDERLLEMIENKK